MPCGGGVPGACSTFENAGSVTGRATICSAGCFGMASSAKNWFCAAAQTTLFAPARYSVLGVRGKKIKSGRARVEIGKP